jgi:hypothetical protein
VVTPAPVTSEASSPVEMRFGTPLPQRRLTVFFRFILAIPQFVVLFFVSIAAGALLIVGWFAALFTGRLPGSIAEFLAGYLRWNMRVTAYTFLITDRYPPFTMEPVVDYPVDLMVHTGRLNRWSVLFRYFLVIPGGIAV